MAVTAKTTTERVRAYRARKRAAGLAEVRGVYAPLAQHEAIKMRLTREGATFCAYETAMPGRVWSKFTDADGAALTIRTDTLVAMYELTRSVLQQRDDWHPGDGITREIAEARAALMAQSPQMMAALQEADTIMGHDESATEWRERWAHLWANGGKQ